METQETTPVKRGRKPLPPEKKKGTYVRFLLTAKERNMLDQSALVHGVTISELLRSMIRTRHQVDVNQGKIVTGAD